MGNSSSQALDNDIEITWRRSSELCPSVARDGHCSASVNNNLYVFGGVVEKTDAHAESNELLCYDSERNTWAVIKGGGDLPAARSAATLAAVGEDLFLFGGLSHETGWFNDIHRFNTVSQKWTKLKPDGGPSARDKVASAVIGENIYIFGGFGPQTVMEEIPEDDDDSEYEDQDDLPPDQEAAQFGWFNDLHIFNTEKNSWSQPMQLNLCPVTPRAAHGMCSVDHYLVIFGGRDAEGRKNDTHVFNTETRKWETKLKMTGQPPEARSFHTISAVDKRVVVFGGRGPQNEHFAKIEIFDTETRQWLQPTISGDDIPARACHSATVVGDKFIVFGGSSNFNQEMQQCEVYYNDMYYIKTVELTSGKAYIDKENVNTELSTSSKGKNDPIATNNCQLGQ